MAGWFPGVVIDFETRSKVDLKSAGMYNYAVDPSTDILCMAAVDLNSDGQWLWYPGEELPPALLSLINDSKRYVIAHNAGFDQLIWECIGVDDYAFPMIETERWYCSAAQCRVNALPGGLDKAIQSLTGRKQKMSGGVALIKELSIPDENGNFRNNPESLRQMGEYCLQDALVTKQVIEMTRPMTQQEHTDWLISERINSTGVRIDSELAGLIIPRVEAEKDMIGDILTLTTQGIITKPTQTQRVRDWMVTALTEMDDTAALKIMADNASHCKADHSFDRNVRELLLSADERGEIHLCEEAYKVTEAMQTASNTSVAKFKRMLEMADSEDERVRGAFVFSGASQTGRFSSKGLQVHNIKRDCLNEKEVYLLKTALINGDEISNPIDTFAKALRPALIPADGCVFVVSDWSAIEARVLHWLTKSYQANKVLDVFKDGGDIYEHTAARMGTGTERQIGKVATLALGYQGGVNAFDSMARNYGVSLPESKIKRIVSDWREAHPWVVGFWNQANNAAINALRHPGHKYTAGRLQYMFAENLTGGTLFCILPDGTHLHYPFAKLETQRTPFDTEVIAVTYMKSSLSPDAATGKWPRATLYGGLAAENATQGVAACLLKNALRQLNNAVLHVHDEIVLELPETAAEAAMIHLQAVMETPPDWADELPLKAEPVIMHRYGK
jgi:DNA polymerase